MFTDWQNGPRGMAFSQEGSTLVPSRLGVSWPTAWPSPPSLPGSSSNLSPHRAPARGCWASQLLLLSLLPISRPNWFLLPQSPPDPGLSWKMAPLGDFEPLGPLKVPFMPSSHLCQCLCPRERRQDQSPAGKRALPPRPKSCRRYLRKPRLRLGPPHISVSQHLRSVSIVPS